MIGPAEVKKNALSCMKVDADLLKGSKSTQLDELFESALDRATGAIGSHRPGSLDPSKLPEWQDNQHTSDTNTPGMPGVFKFLTQCVVSVTFVDASFLGSL